MMPATLSIFALMRPAQMKSATCEKQHSTKDQEQHTCRSCCSSLRGCKKLNNQGAQELFKGDNLSCITCAAAAACSGTPWLALQPEI
jgi:hypothetical protein